MTCGDAIDPRSGCIDYHRCARPACFTRIAVLNASDLAGMNAAKHVLLVTQLDLPCLRNVVRLMNSFEEIDGLTDKVKIIVNRVGMGNGQISLKKAQETMGREIFWKIPNDYRTMVEVRNNGVPLVEQASGKPITQQIIALSEALSGQADPAEENGETQPAGKSGIGRWFSFGK